MGSLGDQHPYIAIALGLKRAMRGLATGLLSPQGRGPRIGLPRRAARLGLRERPRRDAADHALPLGTIRVLRETILPALKETFEETLAAVDTGADLLVSHPITFAARLVAESRGIPWAARPAGDRSHLLPASIYPGPRRRRAGPAARRPGILSLGVRSRGEGPARGRRAGRVQRPGGVAAERARHDAVRIWAALPDELSASTRIAEVRSRRYIVSTGGALP